MEPVDVVTDYYRHLDAEEYTALKALLSPTFTQHRADRTFETPEAFLAFMSRDRPVTGTTHEIDETLESADSIAAYGRLHGPDGAELFAFIDVFSIDETGQISSLVTHS